MNKTIIKRTVAGALAASLAVSTVVIPKKIKAEEMETIKISSEYQDKVASNTVEMSTYSLHPDYYSGSDSHNVVPDQSIYADKATNDYAIPWYTVLESATDPTPLEYQYYAVDKGFGDNPGDNPDIAYCMDLMGPPPVEHDTSNTQIPVELTEVNSLTKYTESQIDNDPTLIKDSTLMLVPIMFGFDDNLTDAQNAAKFDETITPAESIWVSSIALKVLGGHMINSDGTETTGMSLKSLLLDDAFENEVMTNWGVSDSDTLTRMISCFPQGALSDWTGAIQTSYVTNGSQTAHSVGVFNEIYSMTYLADELNKDDGNFERGISLTKPQTISGDNNKEGPFKLNITQGTLYSTAELSTPDTCSLTSERLQDNMIVTPDSTDIKLVTADGNEFSKTGDNYIIPVNTDFYVELDSAVITTGSQTYNFDVTPETIGNVSKTYYRGTNSKGKKTQRMLPYVKIPIVGNFSVSLKNEVEKGVIRVLKTDAHTHDVLSGVSFYVFDQNTNTNAADAIATIETNDQGIATLSDLTYGTYYIKEVAAPDGYQTDNNLYAVEVNKENTDNTTYIHKTVSNYKYGSLVVNKKDPKNNPLENAVFSLTSEEDIQYKGQTVSAGTSIDGDKTTSATGSVSWDALPYGDYILTEKQAPDGYFITVNEYNITIDGDENLNVSQDAINYPYGSIEINKTNILDGSKLEGAIFTVTTTSDIEYNGQSYTANSVIATITTDENGYAKIDSLPYGQYIIKETGAPEGFIKSSDEKSVTINENNVTESVSFSNTPYGSIVLYKVDESENTTIYLSGAEFDVKTLQDTEYKGQNYAANSIIDHIVTDNNGSYTLTNIVPGEYSFIETKAPDGYQPLTAPINATVVADSVAHLNITVSVPNVKLGSLKLEKHDANTKAIIGGAVFEVITVDGTTYNGQQYEANSVIATVELPNGVASISNLMPGNYKIREKSAPSGYSINTTAENVTIVDGEEPPAVVIENYPEVGKIEIHKKDSYDGKDLAGAEFSLTVDGNDDIVYNGVTYAPGEVIVTLITNEQGYASIDDIPYGTYRIDEIKAPNGYEKSDALIRAIVNDQHKSYSFDYYNDSYRDLKIIKIEKGTKTPLIGAEFDLIAAEEILYNEHANIYQEGEIVKSFTITDKDGYTIEHLPRGNYILRETKAPDNYILNTNDIPIDLTEINSPSEIKIVSIENERELRSFSINKLDGDADVSGQPINTYATFNVYADEKIYFPEPVLSTIANVIVEKDQLIGGFTCIFGEEFTINNLPAGKYYLKETKTDDRYLLPDNGEKKIYIDLFTNNSESLEFKIKNYRKDAYGMLKIEKYDSMTKALLDGAEFTIYDEDESPVNTVIVKDGVGYSDELPVGFYTIKETKAPDGYILSDEVFNIEIEANQDKAITIQAENTPILGRIKIIKVDSENNSVVLPGVKFGIYDKDNNLVEYVTTDENGEALSSELHLGKYTIKEISGVDGYVLSDEVYTIELTQDDYINNSLIKVITVENTPIKGVIRVIKQELNNSERKLSGAIFEVYRNDNNNLTLVDTLTTDENGEAETSSLPLGKYTVKEIQAPVGYKIIDDNYEVTLGQKDQTQPIVYESLIIENEKIFGKGQVKLLKYDAEYPENKLSGAKFELIAAEDIYETNKIYSANDVVDTLITDKNGEAISSVIPCGKYTLKEIESPEGYVINPSPINVEVKNDSADEIELKFIKVPNEKIVTPRGQIKIHKTDSKTKKPIDNVSFKLYASENIINETNIIYAKDSLVETLTTNKDGYAISSLLYYGNYYIIEDSIVDGYVENTTVYNVEIKSPYTETVPVVEIKNTPTKVVITKTDITDSSPVPGATIEIRDEYGDVVVEEKTDKNGEIETFYLPVGKYTFKETVAPDGYILNEDKFSFEILSNGKIKGKTEITNTPTEVIITKSDLTTGAPLAGATIEIKDLSGKVWFKDVSGPNGEVKAFKLPVGKYTFTETAAPDGYVRTPETFEFEIYEDGTIRGDCTITNKPTEVVITKSDLTTGKPLAGATIEIKDMTGKVWFNEVSGPNGEVKAFKLPAGRYTFTETAAPDGYVRSPETFEFEIYADGSIKGDCTIKDVPTEVVITKKDLTNAQPLAGAVIQIIDANGNLAYEGTTDKNGEIRAFKLSVGKYTFKEITAPDGYTLNEETFNFELHEDGTVTGDHEIYDTPIPPVKTGVESKPNTNYGIAFLAIACIGIAICGFTVLFKKRK